MGGTEINIQYHADSIDKLQQKHKKIKSFWDKLQKNHRFSLAGGNKKNSAVARSSTGLSQSFPDYRGLAGDEKIIASAALQSAKHSYNIAPNNTEVQNAIRKIGTN